MAVATPLKKMQGALGGSRADVNGGPVCGVRRYQRRWGSVRLRRARLTFRNLLFAIFVERVHDIVQALVYDLPVASHHRHRFPSAQILG